MLLLDPFQLIANSYSLITNKSAAGARNSPVAIPLQCVNVFFQPERRIGTAKKKKEMHASERTSPVVFSQCFTERTAHAFSDEKSSRVGTEADRIAKVAVEARAKSSASPMSIFILLIQRLASCSAL